MLCEVIWVLKTCYKVPKEKLVEIIQALIETKQLSIQEPQVVNSGILVFRCVLPMNKIKFFNYP